MFSFSCSSAIVVYASWLFVDHVESDSYTDSGGPRRKCDAA